MRKVFAVTLSAMLVCAMIFTLVGEVSAISVPSGVRLFDSKSLSVHGYMVYKYNSSSSARDVPVSMELWANNFWSDIKVSQTSPRALMRAYVKYDEEQKEYLPAKREDQDSIYISQFEFDFQPYQEFKADVWFKLSISKVDMSGILREDVGNVSAAKAAVDSKYLREAYYWDYGNSSVEQVIQEINTTIDGSKNVYDIVYAAVDWFSTHMIYMEHEDYPHARLRASQILGENVSFPGYGNKRYGVCRHFVDAFTAIMRGFDVPCNLFNGLVFIDYGGEIGMMFAGGHAWVEVYMPNIGWVPVDVTIPNRYSRDVVRVGLISDAYYLPIYKEFTNEEPQPPVEDYEYLIGAYWGWEVGEVPAGTLESIVRGLTSVSMIDIILLVILLVLIVDRLMLRSKIKALTRW